MIHRIKHYKKNGIYIEKNHYYALIKFGNFDYLKKVLFLDYDLDLVSLNNKYKHCHQYSVS